MLITPLKRFKILRKKNHEERKYKGKALNEKSRMVARKWGEWSVRCYKHGSGPGSISYRTNGREQTIKLAGSHHHSRCREDATVFQPRLSEPPKKQLHARHGVSITPSHFYMDVSVTEA